MTTRLLSFPSRQDDGKGEAFAQPPLPLDVPGQCQDADCGHPATIAGYCHEHYQEQRRRHVAAFDYAAGAD